MRLIFLSGILLWAWAEISIFSFIGSRIGGVLCFFGIFVTAFIGIALLKNQGLSVLRQTQTEIAKGHTLVKSISDSVSLAFGGILMLIPGYITDFFGLFLFVPGFRSLAGAHIVKWIAKYFQLRNVINFNNSNFHSGHKQPSNSGDKYEDLNFEKNKYRQQTSEDVIEGEFKEKPNPTHQLSKNQGD